MAYYGLHFLPSIFSCTTTTTAAHVQIGHLPKPSDMHTAYHTIPGGGDIQDRAVRGGGGVQWQLRVLRFFSRESCLRAHVSVHCGESRRGHGQAHMRGSGQR